MGNRILKESICTSESIDALSAFQETFFYRLIVNCDDYGRMDARPKILAARLFPLKSLRDEQVKDALRALTSAELVTLYDVGGKPFLQMNTWERHQQVRARKSKYPAPDESNGNHLISDDNKCPRNPIRIQSESESESENAARVRTREERTERFEKFWTAYPRHEGKKKAEDAFNKLNPDDELLEIILSALAKWKTSEQWQEDGGRYIPHPTTWLNGRRWEDEVPRFRHDPKNTVIAQQYEQRDYSGMEESMEDVVLRLMREHPDWEDE